LIFEPVSARYQYHQQHHEACSLGTFDYMDGSAE